MTTIQEVSAMLPLLTPYSMPSDSTQAQTLYDIAGEVVDHDITGASDTETTRAYCYYIAHLMSSKDGSATATSEHLGEWSVTYKATAPGSSVWLAQYDAIKDRIVRGSLVAGGRTVTIDDVDTASRYPLDRSGVPE